MQDTDAVKRRGHASACDHRLITMVRQSELCPFPDRMTEWPSTNRFINSTVVLRQFNLSIIPSDNPTARFSSVARPS